MSRANKNETAAPVISGYGESEMFGGKSDGPVMITLHNGTAIPLDDCHLNGQRVGDLKFGAEQLSAIRGLVDEVMGGRNADLPQARVSITRDAVERASIDERYADIHVRGLTVNQARDVPYELTRGMIRPGFVPHYASSNAELSPEQRGMDVVKGKDGQPVKWGNMTLCEYPESVRRQREAEQLSRGREIERRIQGELHAAKEQLAGRSLREERLVQPDVPSMAMAD